MTWFTSITGFEESDYITTKARLGEVTLTNNSNWLLRKLGYAGFSDRSGKGIIHGNEPIQTVILRASACEHIGTVYNKHPENKH